MKTSQELEALAAANPAQLAEELLQNQRQLLSALVLVQLQQEQLLQARAEIAELKRQLFGPKADRLSPEQESILAQIKGDLEEQTQRDAPL